MRRTTVIPRLMAIVILSVGCLTTVTSAQVYETFSSFEFNSSDFTIGNSPATAHFTGGIAQRVFIPMFYHTGVRSWMVTENGTGLITMETTATQIQLWGRDSDTSVSGLIEVFDANNNLIAGSDASFTLSNGTPGEIGRAHV